jgi:glycosyltransferase involved in cell wall biosynthesis
VSDPAISVVIPARNAAATIRRTLACLAAQDLELPYEVIVVDAGSADETASVARATGPDVRVVSAGPVGPAHARNAGVAAARAPRVAFTDADCFPTPGWLAAGIQALERATLVQGAVEPDPDAERGPFDRTIAVTAENGLYETANLFVRRDAFERVGGFEEWFRPTVGPPHMAEDILFGWVMRRAGARTDFAPNALVHHAVFPRGAAGFIAERRRLRYFPGIARKVPELRRAFFYRRAFLSKRSARFDLALVATLVAMVRRSPWPLAGVVPYALVLRRGAWDDPGVGAVHVLADAVGCYSLVLGSVRRRSLLL